MPSLKTLLFLMVILSMPLALSACNTMEGIGKDVGAAGEKLEDEAEENKTY
jgi:predicted small secreted protein